MSREPSGDRADPLPAVGSGAGDAGLAARTAPALLAWFDRHQRDLPWRADRDPYRVWVSEVMLQQTRADTVVRFFGPFLDRFPDVRSLADAPLDDVLKAWEGLGYYRRAHLLHRAARWLVARFDGRLPDTTEELRQLPGFGPYTAAAVAALAYGRPAIAVDANVRRVGARYFAQSVADDGAIVRGLEPWLAGLAAPERVTEALIELGALVCSPRRPRCGACPLRAGCRAARAGDPEAFPRGGSRKQAPIRRRHAQICTDAAGVWLEQRPPDGLLGGLWGFPQHETPLAGPRLGTVRHAYTHFRLELILTAVTIEPAAGDAPAGEHVAWSRVPSLPLSGVDGKVLGFLAAAGVIEPVPGYASAGRSVQAMMPG